MASPSPAAIAAIRARVADWTQSADSIVAALNAPDAAFPNPVAAAPQVTATIDESALLSLLTDPSNGSVVKLVNWPNFGLLKADIDAQNRVGVGLWCQVLVAAGVITAGEAGAVLAYLASTVADPAWRASLSWAQAILGRPVDALDLAAARPGV